MARPNALRDPEFAKAVADAFVAGCSRNEMCHMFGVKDHDTISRWRRDPRVKVHVFKLIEDRVLQVTRRVDGIIADRLANSQDLSIGELLAIRKEFLGGALRAQTEKADDATVAEAQKFLEENPGAMEKLDALLSGQQDGAAAD